MNRRTVRRISLWTIIGLFLWGCASPMFITPPPSSVLDPSSVETVIAGTANAAQTQTAIHIPPTITPTFTPLPTKTITITPSPTATILLITETSVPDGSLSEAGGFEGDDETGNLSSGSGSESNSTSGVRTFENSDYVKEKVIRPWNCRIVSRYPALGATVTAGKPFRVTWVVENTGSKTWPKQGVDIVFKSGAHLHEGKPYLDIPTTVGPGGRVTITITMYAPKRSEEYSNRWSLMVGKTYFCGMKTRIVVK